MRCRVVVVVVALLISGTAAGQSMNLGTTNNSLCFTSDSDDDQSSPVAYDPGNSSCYEAGAFDINVFAVSSSTTGNGTVVVQLDIDAAVVVDANPASSEYEAGRIDYGLSLAISGTGGASWELTVDQQMTGLLATLSDGAGSANVGITGVTASLSLGPSLDFGSFASRSSGDTGSQSFASFRTGDVIMGTGDTVLTGTVVITLDAFSDCGGVLCLGDADEGAVLFGIDDAANSIFSSVDEYATWSRAVGPDGYTATFALAVGAFCGDGNVDVGIGEECDDGNMTSGDGCSDACITEFCGDDVVQPALGESCDDGNPVNDDGCSNICTLEPAEVPTGGGVGALTLLAAVAALGALGLRRGRGSRGAA